VYYPGIGLHEHTALMESSGEGMVLFFGSE